WLRFFFFFQAEDGIRDLIVTGVQTCALPISVADSSTVSTMRRRLARRDEPVSVTSTMASASCGTFTSVAPQENSTWAFTPCLAKIGRASCRERVKMRGGVG